MSIAIILLLIIMLLVFSKLFLQKLNPTLGFDLLNDFHLINKVSDLGIDDLRVYRKRQNMYMGRATGSDTLILLGDNNDVIIPSYSYNTVQDTEIIIMGKNKSGEDVIINKYEYSLENKVKALELMNKIATYKKKREQISIN